MFRCPYWLAPGCMIVSQRLTRFLGQNTRYLAHYWGHVLSHGCSPAWCSSGLCPCPFSHVGSRDCTFLPGQWQAGLCLLPPSPEGSSTCQGLQRFRIQSSAQHHSARHLGVHRACQQQPCFNQKMNISQKAKPERPISKISLFILGLNFMF